MGNKLKRIDISAVPELLRIAEEVRESNEPRILGRDGEDLGTRVGARGACAARPRWAGAGSKLQPDGTVDCHRRLRYHGADLGDGDGAGSAAAAAAVVANGESRNWKIENRRTEGLSG